LCTGDLFKDQITEGGFDSLEYTKFITETKAREELRLKGKNKDS